MQNELAPEANRALVAAVQLPTVSDAEFEVSLTELRELAQTLGFQVVATFTQKRASFDAAAYLGAGKREELRRFVQGETTGAQEGPGPASPDAPVGADIVLVDHEISPSQARILENEVGCEVMDRTMVILEIFHRHAKSRGARAQIEIARLRYLAPRIREAAKLAGPQGRQRSGVGGRGAGESHGELDRRKIRDRIAELQQEINAMDLERRTQRSRRQGRQGLSRVSLVGYTNAGKSTLMRALTGSEVLVANKLFATLDTTVRALEPESVPRVLVSDTVGFIKNLPHDLVASFKSTLEEAAEASLLLHIIDAADPGFERQVQVTRDVLEEIGAKDLPRLMVFNKIDGVGDPALQESRSTELRARYPGSLVISARRPEDIDQVREHLLDFFRGGLEEAELFLPWSAQQLRGQIFANCDVQGEQTEDAGTRFRLRAAAETLRALREQLESAVSD